MRKIRAKASEDEIDEQNYDNFPSTEWHSICIRQCIRVDGTKRFFFRYWEIHIFAPFLLLSVTAFVLTVFILTKFHDLSKTLQIIFLVEIIFLLVFFLINYFEAICMDPGFLPFFWPAIQPSSRKFWYSWQEQMSYLAINSEQFDIAFSEPLTNENSKTINNNQPDDDTNEKISQIPSQISSNSKIDTNDQINEDSINNIEEKNISISNTQTVQNSTQKNFNGASRLGFASFSKSYGRFVIRADHICGWIANWVGKRNHKQFILFLLYYGLFSLSLLLWQFAPKRKNSKSLKERSKTLYYLNVVAILLEVMLTIILIPFFIKQMIHLSQGKTQLQLMKEYQQKLHKSSNEKTNCIYEMRQVCGDGNFLCWICPTPAFGKDLYIEGYS